MSNKRAATYHPHDGPTIDNAREAVLLALIKELEGELHEMRWKASDLEALVQMLREYQRKETT